MLLGYLRQGLLPGATRTEEERTTGGGKSDGMESDADWLDEKGLSSRKLRPTPDRFLNKGLHAANGTINQTKRKNWGIKIQSL